jgi:putative acetyltransferase
MMQLQEGVFPVQPDDIPRLVEVWEASVRATHHFVAESDIQIFRPLVHDSPHVEYSVSVRDEYGIVAGFAFVAEGKVEALFIHPKWRGQGIGKRLLKYAVDALGATALDVNEQNEQALGFYLHMGFKVVGRSERDGMGKPYPLLHMRLMVNEELGT